MNVKFKKKKSFINYLDMMRLHWEEWVGIKVKKKIDICKSFQWGID